MRRRSGYRIANCCTVIEPAAAIPEKRAGAIDPGGIDAPATDDAPLSAVASLTKGTPDGGGFQMNEENGFRASTPAIALEQGEV